MTMLPENPDFTAASKNLSFSVCHSLSFIPHSISPSFLSIAPHYLLTDSHLLPYFDVSLLLCLSSQQRGDFPKSDILLMFDGLFFIVWRNVCVYVYVYVYVHTFLCNQFQGLQRGLCLDREDRKESGSRGGIFQKRVCVDICLCVCTYHSWSAVQVLGPGDNNII